MDRWMSLLMAAGLVVLSSLSAAAEDPLRLEASRDGSKVTIDLELLSPLPAGFEAALDAAVDVSISYRFEADINRYWWLDNMLWRGRAVATSRYDPVVGRYRMSLVLDQIVVASEETTDRDLALAWLIDPPSFEIELPARKRQIRLRVRAVFADEFRFLVIPWEKGTDWKQIILDEEP